MRDTTFRAKTVSRGTWAYGDYFSRYEDGITTHYILSHPNGRDAGREVMWEIDPETLGQGVGLDDRHGTSIFEGDILKIPSMFEWCSEIRGRVFFGHVTDDDHESGYDAIGWFMELWWLRNGRISNDQRADVRFLESNHERYESYEVIGNIHSDPDLLEASA